MDGKTRNGAAGSEWTRRAWTGMLTLALLAMTNLVQAQDAATSGNQAEDRRPTADTLRNARDASGQAALQAPTARPSGNAIPTETPQGAVTGAPAIRIDEPTHDFGAQWSGGNLEHAFIVRNDGDQLLEITNVRPSCGCTVAKGHTREIAPGGEGRIPLIINTKRLHNTFKKNVTIACNDPVTPRLRLTIQGEIKHLVQANPARVSFGHVKETQSETKTATIVNNTDEPMTLALDGDSKNDAFTVELVEKVPGKEFDLVINANPPYKPKSNNAKFVFNTGIEGQPTVEVPVSAFCPPRIELRPEQLRVPARVSGTLNQRVRFMNNSEDQVHVTEATVNDDQLSVEVVEKVAGKHYEISLTIPKGYEAPPTGRVITLRTDDPQNPEMKLPINATRSRQASKPKPAEALLGKMAPKAEWTTFEGKSVTTGEETGQVTILDFYASWCGYCKRQIPSMSKLYEEKYKDNPNVRFVAVSQDIIKEDPTDESNRRARTPEQVKEMFAQYGSFENVLDRDRVGRTGFKVSSYPTLMVLGKSGVVEAVHFGAKADLVETVDKQIQMLLEGKTHKDFDGNTEGATAAATPKKTPSIRPNSDS